MADRFPAGTILVFQGYAPGVPENEQTLAVGTRLQVDEATSDGYTVYVLDEAGNKRPDVREQVYDSEVVPEGDGPVETAAAPAAPAAPAAAPKATAKKGKDATKAKAAAPKATAKAEAKPATAKKGGSTKGAAAAAAALVETTKKGKDATKAPVAAGAEKATANLPVPQVAEDPLAVSVEDTPQVKRVLEEAPDALQAAKMLRDRIEEGYFTLAGTLHHIYVEGLHKTAGAAYQGKRGFADYCAAELKLDYRTAMYLIKIYVKARQLELDEAKLMAIGWTKARELVNLPDETLRENFDELIDKATTLNRVELTEAIKREYLQVEPDQVTPGTRVQATTYTLKVIAADTEIVDRALEHAKREAQTDDTAAAFVYICSQYSLQNEGVNVPLEQEIAMIEARHGIKLTVGVAGTADELSAAEEAEAAAGAGD